MTEAERPSPNSRTAFFSMRVRDFMRPRHDIAAIRAGTTCAEVLAALTAAPVRCAVVVDIDERPIGIVTMDDIARRVTYRLPEEASVESVMTRPILTIAQREYLYHAIARMRRNSLRRLIVVDHSGRLAGLIELLDAMAVAADRLMRQIDRLGQEATIEGLKQVKAAEVELAEQLFTENVPAIDIQQLITRINNDIYRRLSEAVSKAMADEGWGEPPVAAAVIVMGSGGRGENYLFPDQDNGFILADYPDVEHGRIDAFFLEAAERLCRSLNEIGIAYCNGYCMAVNPLWRKSLSQWIDQITLWAKKSNFVAIRLADIFFDFEPVFGSADLARSLRAAVTGLVRNNRAFLRQMFQDKADHNVALGPFGGFLTEKANGTHRGHVNLKLAGLIPLVGAVRLLALREGVEQTSTLARLRELHRANVLSERERDDLTVAFSEITDILLRQQVADYRIGREVTYYIDPERLGKRRRADLIAALRAIDAIRNRVRIEFTGQVF